MPMQINPETGLPEYVYQFSGDPENEPDPNKPQPGQPGYDEDDDDEDDENLSEEERQKKKNEQAVKEETDRKAEANEPVDPDEKAQEEARRQTGAPNPDEPA